MSFSKAVVQDFDYFLVLDFEATCIEKSSSDTLPFQEIIEFPTCAVNSQTQKIDFEFHQYVRPSKYQKLSSFCTDLTGIQQNWVDQSSKLSEVLSDYEKWLESTKLREKRIIWITCGDWDLNTMLPQQCEREGIPLPSWLEKFGYINIKKCFCDCFKVEARGMTRMLDYLNIKLDGRHHSGIDDSRNTAKIFVRMLQEGYFITTKFYDISILGHYIRLGEGIGSVCIGCWFPNESVLNSHAERFGYPSLIVTCMNRREGGKKAGRFIRGYRKQKLVYRSLSYPGTSLLGLGQRYDENLKEDLDVVSKHLRGGENRRVLVLCSRGNRKSATFLYLLLRWMEKSEREAIEVIRNSRYRSIEFLDEKRVLGCEELLKRVL